MRQEHDATVKTRTGNIYRSRLLALVGLMFLFGISMIAPYEPALADSPEAQITVLPDEGEVGASVTIEGSGFAPLAQINLEFGNDELSLVNADGDGQFSFELEVPELTPAGLVSIIGSESSNDENLAEAEFLVINTPPVADPHSPVEVEENGSELIILTASDVNGDALTLEIVDDPSHGYLPEVHEDTGEVVYVPDSGFVGSDSFSFRVTDGISDSDIIMVSVTVAAEDPADDADIEVRTDEDEEATITLEATDPGSPTTFEIVSQPDHGSLGDIESTGPDTARVVFSPEPDYNGHDEFAFRAYGGSGGSTGTVSIEITAVNDAPVGLATIVNVNENSKRKIMLEAFDAEDDPVTYSIATHPVHGTLSGSPPDLYYDPEQDYIGSDAFRFRVSDSIAEDEATITISVGGGEYYEDEEEEYRPDINAAPVSYSQEISGAEDVPINIELAAEDMNGDALTFSIIEYPSFGEVTDFNDSSGNLTYIPAEEFSGTDSFAFIASDGHKKTKKATVSITIEPVNDPPSPVSTNVTAPQGSVNITLAAFDPEGDLLEFSIFSGPANGTLAGNSSELFYAANEGFVGHDNFLFTVTDKNRPDSRIGVISILVGEPTAVGDDNIDQPGESEGTDSDDGVGPAILDEPEGKDNESVDEKNRATKDDKESTTKARADKSKVLVQLAWEHHSKEHEIQSTLRLQFSDYKTREALGTHVWYDLVMLDEKNNEILSKYDLIAFDSEDAQQITFPANGTYHFEVNVKGLVDKSTNAISRDTDYTGKALGIVVVPEFSSSIILMAVMVALMGSTVLAIRYRRSFDRVGCDPSGNYC